MHSTDYAVARCPSVRPLRARIETAKHIATRCSPAGRPPFYTVSQKTVHFCFCQNFVKFPLILITFGRLDGKMAEIVCYVCIFLMSLQYLVKGGYSKFLPNTGFVTIRLLRFGVKVKRAYCRNDFLAQRPLPDMGKLSGDGFLCFNRTYGAVRHLGASARDTVAFLERERERCEKRVVV